MGALDSDTRLETVDAVPGADASTLFRGDLSRDWEIWGPNGGYVAVVALRAAAAHSAFGRPVSYSGHFLSVAEFGAVDVEARTLRRTKRAESVRVSLSQRGAPIVEALVWMAQPGDGLQHDDAAMPDVAGPEGVPSNEERGIEIFPFWRNFEVRAPAWIDDWENRPAGEYRERTWFRFSPRPALEDPAVDAGRMLLLLDTMLWPAANRGHPENRDWYAPSVDIQCRFHALAPDDEWLLIDAHSPKARDGLVGGTGSVWTRSRGLVASGGQQMLCRPQSLNPNPIPPASPPEETVL